MEKLKKEGSWQGIYADILNDPKVILRYDLEREVERDQIVANEVEQQFALNTSVRDIIKGQVASIYIPSFSLTESNLNKSKSLLKLT